MENRDNTTKIDQDMRQADAGRAESRAAQSAVHRSTRKARRPLTPSGR